LAGYGDHTASMLLYVDRWAGQVGVSLPGSNLDAVSILLPKSSTAMMTPSTSPKVFLTLTARGSRGVMDENEMDHLIHCPNCGKGGAVTQVEVATAGAGLPELWVFGLDPPPSSQQHGFRVVSLALDKDYSKLHLFVKPTGGPDSQCNYDLELGGPGLPPWDRISVDLPGENRVQLGKCQTNPCAYTKNCMIRYLSKKPPSGTFTRSTTENIRSITVSPFQKFFWLSKTELNLDELHINFQGNERSVVTGGTDVTAVLEGDRDVFKIASDWPKKITWSGVELADYDRIQLQVPNFPLLYSGTGCGKSFESGSYSMLKKQKVDGNELYDGFLTLRPNGGGSTCIQTLCGESGAAENLRVVVPAAVSKCDLTGYRSAKYVLLAVETGKEQVEVDLPYPTAEIGLDFYGGPQRKLFLKLQSSLYNTPWFDCRSCTDTAPAAVTVSTPTKNEGESWLVPAIPDSTATVYLQEDYPELHLASFCRHNYCEINLELGQAGKLPGKLVVHNLWAVQTFHNRRNREERFSYYLRWPGSGRYVVEGEYCFLTPGDNKGSDNFVQFNMRISAVHSTCTLNLVSASQFLQLAEPPPELSGVLRKFVGKRGLSSATGSVATSESSLGLDNLLFGGSLVVAVGVMVVFVRVFTRRTQKMWSKFVNV